MLATGDSSETRFTFTAFRPKRRSCNSEPSSQRPSMGNIVARSFTCDAFLPETLTAFVVRLLENCYHLLIPRLFFLAYWFTRYLALRFLRVLPMSIGGSLHVCARVMSIPNAQDTSTSDRQASSRKCHDIRTHVDHNNARWRGCCKLCLRQMSITCPSKLCVCNAISWLYNLRFRGRLVPYWWFRIPSMQSVAGIEGGSSLSSYLAGGRRGHIVAAKTAFLLIFFVLWCCEFPSSASGNASFARRVI